MKKRGMGHIEVILSFVLFVTAVGFGLYFFNTGDSARLVETSLAYAFREIEQNTSTSIEVFSVSVNDSLVTGALALNFSGVGGNTSVETYSGEILDSSRGGVGDELVYVSSSSWIGQEILFVIFGEEFQEDALTETAEHNKSFYQIGSSEVREVISGKKFKMLNNSYHADYLDLKKQKNFNLPDRVDFGFSLIFEDGSGIVAEKEILDNFEVFSETKRVEVLREDGSLVFADLIVKVW